MSTVVVFENNDYGFVSIYKGDTPEQVRAALYTIIKELADRMVYPPSEREVSGKTAQLAMLEPDELPEPFKTEVIAAKKAVRVVEKSNAEEAERYAEFTKLMAMTVEEASQAVVPSGKYSVSLAMNVWNSYFDHDSDYQITVEEVTEVLP